MQPAKNYTSVNKWVRDNAKSTITEDPIVAAFVVTRKNTNQMFVYNYLPSDNCVISGIRQASDKNLFKRYFHVSLAINIDDLLAQGMVFLCPIENTVRANCAIITEPSIDKSGEGLYGTDLYRYKVQIQDPIHYHEVPVVMNFYKMRRITFDTSVCTHLSITN